jgi:predicted nuclease of predicted toxin-antitoxin system
MADLLVDCWEGAALRTVYPASLSDARLLHPLGGRWLTARPLFYFASRYARVIEGKDRDNYEVACQFGIERLSF